MKSYSQNQEDLIIRNDLGIEPKSILDIGANDGRTFSNSLAFIEEYGAHAICVEPDPYAFCKLTQEHKNHHNVTCVLGMLSVTGAPLQSFTLFQDSLLSSGDDEHIERWQSPHKLHKPIQTSTIRWRDITALHSRLQDDESFPVEFDLITIDTEGMNGVIAQSMPSFILDYAKVIIIERGRIKGEGGAYVKTPMDSFSNLNKTHKLYHETSENLIYVRR